VGRPVDVEFPTVERSQTLSDRVTAQLLEMITSSALKPGDRLPSERDLCDRLGVSRTVVREAMRSLAAKGVLEVRSGSGAVVGRVGAERASEALRLYVMLYSRGEDGLGIDYAQIDDVREMIEARVTRISATTATQADLDALTATHGEFEAALDDPEAASRLDVAFHRLIAVSTHNPLYLVMLDSIEPLLLEIRRKTLGAPGRPRRAAKAHARILERIVAGDAAGAEAAMLDHLEDSRAVWQGKAAPTEAVDAAPPAGPQDGRLRAARPRGGR
jgi:GntR family transcriptional regulator, transcriptional repressor for pyruvate dehydrogenase complex